MSAAATSQLEAIWRADSRRVLATLIRLLGNFEQAEEALADAFAAAADQWPRDGLPANPFAWLVSAGRFRAIDRLRQRARHDASADDLAMLVEERAEDVEAMDDKAIRDDQLRLIFTCCHPALPADAQIAITLREVCGLTTEEIAAAYLSPASTIAQRIVRAKNRIRAERIPYETPERNELPGRLECVLRAIYLVVNEGYSASSGDPATRPDLTGEAIRLGRLLVGLLPDPEAIGLLALMLLQEARRSARTDVAGEVILLEDQDRSLWDRQLIAEGRALVSSAFAKREVGSYAIQAAIALEHAKAASLATTDWTHIASLYDLLLTADPSPIVELNRAVAIAERDGEAAGLELIDAIFSRGELLDYYPAHAARGELNRRLGRAAAAIAAYEKALALVKQGPVRSLIERRRATLVRGDVG